MEMSPVELLLVNPFSCSGTASLVLFCNNNFTFRYSGILLISTWLQMVKLGHGSCSIGRAVVDTVVITGNSPQAK